MKIRSDTVRWKSGAILYNENQTPVTVPSLSATIPKEQEFESVRESFAVEMPDQLETSQHSQEGTSKSLHNNTVTLLNVMEM